MGIQSAFWALTIKNILIKQMLKYLEHGLPTHGHNRSGCMGSRLTLGEKYAED